MKNELLPISFPGINDEVYAGFWMRVAAKMLDMLILLPLMGLVLYVTGLSKLAYFFAIVPNLLVYIWFEVYLVKRYGGTPGKLIMGIKIIQKNGDDTDWSSASLRYVIEFCLSILGIIVMIWTLNLIDDNTYMSLGFLKRSQLLSQINPIPTKIQMWITYIWQFSLIIVLLLNSRKRTVHDYIAGTVVIKSIYLDKIREAIIQPVMDDLEK